jgi:glycerol-3-phosphate dehydrogenase
MNFSRPEQLQELESKSEFDLLIIGGGIVGSAALEMAASSGLSSILLEKNDFASGASGRSTKLLHGGIRYLPQLQFGLVRESLQEQKILVKLLGGLYKPLKLLAPIYKDDGFADLPKIIQYNFISSFAFKLGLTLYDLLGSRTKKQRHINFDKSKTREMFPLLKQEKLKRSFIFQDAQTDDAKLVVTLLRNAVEINNATAINYMEITDIKKQSSRYQITAINKLKGNKYEFFANNIIAATGVHALPGDYAVKSSAIKFSGGAHLILKDDPLKINGNGILLPKTEDNRIMFVLPWFGNTIVGTTDTETFSGTLDRPYAIDDDIDYIIRHIKKYFNVDNVEYISSWSGIRALIDNKLTSTKNVSRGHFFNNVDDRFIQISGGKLTGFRLIAKESLELLFSNNFELTPLRFTDDVLNLSNNFNKDDLKKCFKHYCIAKPTDYMLRRTHISWFNNNGGKDEFSKIIQYFDLDGIEVDTSEELYGEGLLKETY